MAQFAVGGLRVNDVNARFVHGYRLETLFACLVERITPLSRIIYPLQIRQAIVHTSDQLNPPLRRQVENEKIFEILRAVDKTMPLRMPIQFPRPQDVLLQRREVQRRPGKLESERRNLSAIDIETGKHGERIGLTAQHEIRGTIEQTGSDPRTVADPRQRLILPVRQIVEIFRSIRTHAAKPILLIMNRQQIEAPRRRVEPDLRIKHLIRAAPPGEELPLLHQRIARKTVDRIAFVRAERIPHHDTLPEGQHRVFAQEVPADGNAHGVQRIAGSIFKEIGMSDSRRRTIATYYK